MHSPNSNSPNPDPSSAQGTNQRIYSGEPVDAYNVPKGAKAVVDYGDPGAGTGVTAALKRQMDQHPWLFVGGAALVGAGALGGVVRAAFKLSPLAGPAATIALVKKGYSMIAKEEGKNSSAEHPAP